MVSVRDDHRQFSSPPSVVPSKASSGDITVLLEPRGVPNGMSSAVQLAGGRNID